ncbi:MAG: hypothetical protein ABJB47_00610 [Actinomycetota bacterium]
MAETGERQDSRSLIGIYLNDHLAGATAGAGLAHRMAASGHLPVAGSLVQQLAVEIAQDRAALLEFMVALDVPVRGYKVWAAWVGEKAGRLKPNGHLVSRSMLSNLEELEMLRLGVEGKAAGWRTLRTLASQDSRLDVGRLDKLIASAQRQGELIEELRMNAAEQVIGTSRNS